MYSRRFCIGLASATMGLLVAAESATKRTPTPSPAPPKYVVTLGNLTVWNGVSHRVDTDYLALFVQGPKDQKFSKTDGPLNLRKKNVVDWKLSSTLTTVPADPHSALIVSWAAVNSGTSHTQELATKLNSVAEQIGENVPNVYSVLISFIAGHIVGFFTTNCDCALFGQKVTFTGAQLASGQLGPQWSSEGTGRWHAVFDYPDIKSKCDTGHYNLEVHIQKVQ
jgi:hypothetical protein